MRFRERLWRVDARAGGEFIATPLDGRDLHPRRFAAAVERVEDGQLPFPAPDVTTDITEQDLLLRAHQLALVHGSAPIVGLQRSRAIPTEFQIVPLLMALGRERVRLLIADDVGIGKTVEAGLVLAELLARGLARRVLVVTPWNLCEQWREALAHFFHLEGTVIASHLMPSLERRLLPGQSPWEAHDICIASVDYLKLHGPKVLQYRWDMAIIDEAHVCARPHSGARQSAPDMLRHAFARDVAEQVEQLLLLTATPHNGFTDSYASLLALLDPKLVLGADETLHINREHARRHVCQRRRKDIEEWYGKGSLAPFPTRDAEELVVKPSKAQAVLLDKLREYTDELDEQSDVVPLNAWVAAHLQKRALSSPHALRRSVDRRLRRLRAARPLEEPERDDREALIEVTEDLAGEGLSDEQRSERVDVSVTTLDRDREIAYLERIAELAKKVGPAQDRKLRELLELVPRRADAHLSVRRVIVFTRYKDTLNYVAKALRKLDRVAVHEIYGELSATQRREVFAAFAHDERAVLVATDCISEGLNLQHVAAEIVHYELPWNPNRLEQRNGRVDRFGQREKVVGIRTLVFDDQLDMAVLETSVRKAERMREEFGFAPPFFASGATIRDLLRRHGRRRQMALWDEVGSDPGDEADRGRLEHVKAESFFGQTDISLGEVSDVLQQSRAVTGSAERVQVFVGRALAHVGAQLREVGGGHWTVDGSPSAIADVLPPEGGRLTFDPEIGSDDPDIDVVDLAHPLLRRLVDVVRDRSLGPGAPGRVTGRAIPGIEEACAVLHVLARFVTASAPPVILEELVPVLLPVYADNVDARDPDDLVEVEPVPSPGLLSRDVADAAGAVLARPDLGQRLAVELDALRDRLIERHASLDGGWARGLDDVRLASRDPVALTILFPEAAA